MTQNVQARDDRRVQRTRQLLQEALVELTIQQGFAAVTVRDICEVAQVNRATFYRHYLDKYDLLEQYGQQVHDLLDGGESRTGTEIQPYVSTDQAPAGLVRLLEQVQTNARFYRVMLGPEGHPGFVQQIQKYIEDRIRSGLPPELISAQGQAPIELCLSSISSGALGSIRWWLEHDMPYTPEQLAAFAVQFSIANLQVALAATLPSPVKPNTTKKRVNP